MGLDGALTPIDFPGYADDRAGGDTRRALGVPLTGLINTVSYTLWVVSTLIVGVIVLRGERAGRTVPVAA